MIAKLKSLLASFKLLRALSSFTYYIKNDFQRGRFRGVLLIGLGNLLPDLLCFCVVRAIFWRLAGVQLADYSNTIIRSGVFTEYPANLIVGKNFHVNRNSYLDTNSQISIGDHVTISLNCAILTVSHSGRNHEVDLFEPVVIKSHCLIYANCTILPGAVLEEGVVLAAGSVLRGVTEPWSIYAGVPAKRVKARAEQLTYETI
jgi:acetyltransferase-like isoleucine patch superfamily enzyme